MRRLLLAVPLLPALALPAPPAQAGGGCHEPMTEGRATTVRLVHACFSPTVVRVPVGATVRWENASGLDHNMTGADRWFHDLFRDGTTYSRRFTAAGIYPYACTLHVGMVGVVAVGDRIGAPAAESVEAGTGTLDLGPGSDTAAEADARARGHATLPEESKADGAAEPVPAAASDDVPGSAGAWLAGGLLACVAAGLAVGTGRRRRAVPVAGAGPHA